MRVKLISHTENPERTIAAAMRLCYSASDIKNILDGLDDENCDRMIAKALKLGHFSVLEHASYTFAIEDISRACSHQLVRHRMASYSQQSQRYVKMHNFDHSMPLSIQNNKQALDQYNSMIDKISQQYESFLELGIPAEDARYILPNSADTKIVMTANARSLINFFELRLCTRAQWEIRELAEKMLDILKEISPSIFSNAGPTCVSKGYCSEGEMSCGRLDK